MRSPLVSGLVAAVALAGVPSALAAQPPDPCALITVLDATGVFGVTPSAGKAKTVGGIRTCTYAVKKKTLTVQTKAVATKAAFVKDAKSHGGGVFPIHGVGADAYSAAEGTILVTWKNGTEVTFTFAGVNPFVATQQSLAKAALGEL